MCTLGIAAMSLYFGFEFIRSGTAHPWVPFACAALTFLASVGLWLKSYQGVDSGVPPPAQIEVGNRDTDNFVSVTVDRRMLESEDDIAIFERLLSAVRYRQPLPDSDGLVNSDGTFVPNTKEEAGKKIEVTNLSSERIKDYLLSLLNRQIQNPPSGLLDVEQLDQGPSNHGCECST